MAMFFNQLSNGSVPKLKSGLEEPVSHVSDQ